MGSLAQFRSVLKAIAPALAVLLGMILLVVPLRLGQGYVPTPLLPMIVVFLYAVYDPEALPPPVVFGLGLLHDFFHGSGLGVWASVYLALQYLVYSQAEYLRGRVFHVIWLAFVLAGAGVSLMMWAERSLLAGSWVPIWPMIRQLVVTFAVYPLIAMLFFFLRHRAIERGQAGA